MIVPAIERTGQWRVWVDWARQLAYPVLQARVSEALQAAPRGREPEPPRERFRRAILAGLPDIEAMEVVERFFELGAKVVGTPHPVGIFLAGCRECLAEWEVQAALGRRVPSPSVDIQPAHFGRNDHSDRSRLITWIGGDDHSDPDPVVGPGIKPFPISLAALRSSLQRSREQSW